jgi:hypothetical protein
MSQHNSQFKDKLVGRITEALAREDVSALTVRQLREFVARIVDDALLVAEMPLPAAILIPSRVDTPPQPAVNAMIEAAEGVAIMAPAKESHPEGQSLATEPEIEHAADLEVPPSGKIELGPPAPDEAVAMQRAAANDDDSDVQTIRVPIGAIALIIGVLIIAVLLIRSSLGAGPAGAPRIDTPLVSLNPANNAAPAAPQQQAANAKNPTVSSDGTIFQPARTFTGDTTGKAYEITFGKVTVKNGALTLLVGGIPGYDGVYDYARLKSGDGKEIQVEAEDSAVTKGDAFANDDRPEDGHWWLQSYGDFSANKGLVIRKQERVPLLTTTINLADGEYDLFIGSFKGDPGNGVFALGVTAK